MRGLVTVPVILPKVGRTDGFSSVGSDMRRGYQPVGAEVVRDGSPKCQRIVISMWGGLPSFAFNIPVNACMWRLPQCECNETAALAEVYIACQVMRPGKRDKVMTID
jgi:hypothetical protein